METDGCNKGYNDMLGTYFYDTLPCQLRVLSCANSTLVNNSPHNIIVALVRQC